MRARKRKRKRDVLGSHLLGGRSRVACPTGAWFNLSLGMILA